jgi:hypothetical protein
MHSGGKGAELVVVQTYPAALTYEVAQEGCIRWRMLLVPTVPLHTGRCNMSDCTLHMCALTQAYIQAHVRDQLQCTCLLNCSGSLVMTVGRCRAAAAAAAACCTWRGVGCSCRASAAALAWCMCAQQQAAKTASQ